ncbi:hypothetical protein KI387_014682, partial [Taxus chinensis]
MKKLTQRRPTSWRDIWGEGEDESEEGGDEEKELEKDKEPLEPRIVSVYDSKEESGEENKEFIFTRQKGKQGDESTEDTREDESDVWGQRAIDFTKEKITEVAEQEVKKMLEILVDQELEWSANIVLKEGKEESGERGHDSLGGLAPI